MVTSDDVTWATRRLEHYARLWLNRERKVPVDPWGRERIVADIVHDVRRWADLHDERARMDAVLDEVNVELFVDPSECVPILRVRWSPRVDEPTERKPWTPRDVEFTYEGGASVDAWPGHVSITVAPDDGGTATPAQARELAAALLAAADEAERSEG